MIGLLVILEKEVPHYFLGSKGILNYWIYTSIY